MTSLIALTIFLSLSLAVPQLIRPCTCPLPICPLEFIAKCRCENAAALACWEQYSTQGIVCASPTPAPCGGAITRDVTACVCEPKGCLQIWPESCYCANAIKKECFDKCGGVELVYQSCPPLGARKPCSGLRGTTCPTRYVCIDDPSSTDCGMTCDRPGICVSDKSCGGFLVIACPKGQKCVDAPRNSCDPAGGGANCVRLCV
ncbi:hypothetical protein V2W45_1470590 [Cenococcum geophilum]